MTSNYQSRSADVSQLNAACAAFRDSEAVRVRPQRLRVWAAPIAGLLCAVINEPRRKIVISEMLAASPEKGLKALKPKAKAAIERDLLTRPSA